MDDRFIIKPKIGKKDPILPERVIIVPTFSMLELLVPGGKKNMSKLGVLENTFFSLIKSGNVEAAVCGPVIGAPAAAILMEKIIACGGKKILFFGSCGAISPSLEIGDIFIPDGGISEEGTSVLYLKGEKILSPSMEILSALEIALKKSSLSYKKGRVWTTDAPFMETVEKVEYYSSLSVLAVDMEFTALCAVAMFRQVSFAALMVVSDILYKKEWAHGFPSAKFKDGKTNAVEIITKVLADI
ncbi:MAG: nucleoside phosphorylase [Candidatus Schekmanbacteria bacterium]|nr:nucleoside phosphorylase [Candidatus Schekmanbacteria bacterium]